VLLRALLFLAVLFLARLVRALVPVRVLLRAVARRAVVVLRAFLRRVVVLPVLPAVPVRVELRPAVADRRVVAFRLRRRVGVISAADSVLRGIFHPPGSLANKLLLRWAKVRMMHAGMT
jgi:hypothetical protein